MAESWSDRRPAQRRGPDPLEQRLDRLVSAGRQLVDGVSGARPGARSPGRPGLPRLDGLGRWVENKLDWILEDEEDWREPWQQGRPESPPPATPARRRPLDAISRRRSEPLRPEPQQPGSQPSAASEWPEDEAFVVPRWQRPVSPSPSPSGVEPAPAAMPPGRAVPRSTRRRWGPD